MFKAQQECCGKQSECLVVHCENLADLINEVLLSRKVFTEHLIKFEINGGGGFLKVCLGVIALDNTNNAVFSPSKRLLTQQISKNIGVKQQMLVAISEELPENYHNVFLHLFKLIQLGLSSHVI